ncbi:hypothetical protein C8J56DRAFT_725028, partial [Mycena floridula]
TYKKLRKPIPVYLGDEYAINATGIGTVCWARDGDRRKLVLTQVLHVPDLSIALISTSRLTAEGFRVIFDGENCDIAERATNEVLASAKMKHGLFYLTGSPLLKEQ